MAVDKRDLGQRIIEWPTGLRIWDVTMWESGDTVWREDIVAAIDEPAARKSGLVLLEQERTTMERKLVDVSVRRATVYVVAREVSQGYGGPEEGGWWFPVSVPLAAIPCKTTSHAKWARTLLLDMYEREYANRRPMHSAAGGEDLWIGIEHAWPEPQPSTRPHYE